jgi:hypothetical protein
MPYPTGAGVAGGAPAGEAGSFKGVAGGLAVSAVGLVSVPIVSHAATPKRAVNRTAAARIFGLIPHPPS